MADLGGRPRPAPTPPRPVTHTRPGYPLLHKYCTYKHSVHRSLVCSLAHSRTMPMNGAPLPFSASRCSALLGSVGGSSKAAGLCACCCLAASFAARSAVRFCAAKRCGDASVVHALQALHFLPPLCCKHCNVLAQPGIYRTSRILDLLNNVYGLYCTLVKTESVSPELHDRPARLLRPHGVSALHTCYHSPPSWTTPSGRARVPTASRFRALNSRGKRRWLHGPLLVCRMKAP